MAAGNEQNGGILRSGERDGRKKQGHWTTHLSGRKDRSREREELRALMAEKRSLKEQDRFCYI
jgi:hypothetical protein